MKVERRARHLAGMSTLAQVDSGTGYKRHNRCNRVLIHITISSPTCPTWSAIRLLWSGSPSAPRTDTLFQLELVKYGRVGVDRIEGLLVSWRTNGLIVGD
jgi:hypothetical protein